MTRDSKPKNSHRRLKTFKLSLAWTTYHEKNARFVCHRRCLGGVFGHVCAVFGCRNRNLARRPKQLEPLRGQSRTLVGPQFAHSHFHIPFTKREEFESAWPHFLKVKSKGAPVILVRAPKTDFFAIKPAGVLIHSPPDAADKRKNPEAPIAGVTNLHRRWMNTTYIELAVDGQIVDLNRIALPADTPIIDQRFQDGDKKAPAKSGG